MKRRGSADGTGGIATPVEVRDAERGLTPTRVRGFATP
jgi:hypothetical protein